MATKKAATKVPGAPVAETQEPVVEVPQEIALEGENVSSETPNEEEQTPEGTETQEPAKVDTTKAHLTPQGWVVPSIGAK